ncbi:hypothetical protein ACFOGI_08620 [Virgibacillus xinjiangensis]|uniref:Hydrolase n=1 Tax=Virgibacillus xinjiangensis TaxID=393090 RepID=A0ABV7CVJ3_9BACI
MAEKKQYFVTIDTEEIREVSIPDSGIEFEIEATEGQVEELRHLFIKRNQNAVNASNYVHKPFDEWGADEERASYNKHMVEVYRKVYELGTKETKEKISELGIIN